jgi:hypothetical protein
MFGNIKGTLGAIDVKEIPISKPFDHPMSYINRKFFSSIKLQCVATTRRIFTDLYCGEVGSMHDARMFRRSPLYEVLRNENQRRHLLPREAHILGDGAYPLSTYLLTPFRNNGHLQGHQVNFNSVLASMRVCIENAWGLLESRFRCLKYLLRYATELTPLITSACCCFHNICIQLGDEGDFTDDDSDEEEEDLMLHYVLPPGEGIQAGAVKRDVIAWDLFLEG